MKPRPIVRTVVSGVWERRKTFLVLTYGVLNAILYAGILPLWDGFDEPFHYAYVQQLSRHLSLPVLGKTGFSAEIDRSLAIAPASHLVKRNVPSAITFGEYLRLPEAGRRSLRAQLEHLDGRNLPSGQYGLNYEAHQPPLAYALLAPFDRVWANVPLPYRVLRLRLLCALFSALATGTLSLALAKRIGLPEYSRLSVAFLIFSSQMFYATVGHVANDWLAIPIFSGLLLCCIDYHLRPGWRRLVVLSVVLAAGLLTKAYFLAAVPLAFAVVALACWRRSATRLHLPLFCIISAALSGPWYLRNLLLYHNLSGMQETSGGIPVWDILKSAVHLPWFLAAVRLTRGALWTGNNSATTFNSFTIFVMTCLLAAGALLYCSRAVREGVSWAERFLMYALLSDTLALAYAAAVTFRYTNGVGISPSPWYAQVLETPALCLLLAGVVSSGIPGRIVRVALLWVWAYVICATYVAKLLPFYAGYSRERANPLALLQWYVGQGAQARSVLDTVSLMPANVLMGLALGVSVSAFALATWLSRMEATEKAEQRRNP